MKLNIHSLLFAVVAFAMLPLSANAASVTYSFNLSGSQETPAAGTPAAGSAQVTIDDVAGTFSFAVLVFNLQGSPAAGHIHFAPAGVAGPVVYDLAANADFAGLISVGSISLPNSLAMAGADKPIATELAALINASPWDYYMNIHTSAFPDGEVRGQLATAPVPLPAGIWLLGSALGLSVLRRRKT